MLLHCSSSFKVLWHGKDYYAFGYKVVDTDDFVAEDYEDDTDELLSQCGLKIDSMSLSKYVSRMTSPFIGEDFCFKAFIEREEYHILYKGLYYYVKDDGSTIKINDFEYQYHANKYRGKKRELSFIGILGDSARLDIHGYVHVVFNENSATLCNTINCQEIPNLKGIRMSKEAFLRKLMVD